MLKFRTHREILTSLITEAYKRGLLSDDSKYLERIARGEAIENAYVLFLAAFADVLAGYYQDMQSLLDSLDVDVAKGDDLDRLASLVGLERRGPTRSVAPIVFERVDSSDSSSEIHIPGGTRIASERGTIYTTLYEAFIKPGELQANTYAISLEAGPATQVGIGELDRMIDTVEGVRVYNPEASTGGLSEETDEELAQRIRMWAFEQQKGTYTAYESALNRVAGLRSWKIIPRWDGPGTVKIIVDPPADTVIKFVEDAIVDVQAADEDVKVMGVSETRIDVHCVVNFDAGALLVGRKPKDLAYVLERDIRAYIDGGRLSNGQIVEGLKIGEDFNPFKLGNFLASIHTGLENVDFEYPAKKVFIDDDKRAKSGVIKVTVA